MRDDDVEAASQGDERAFARLVERTHARALAIARRILWTGDDAEDVLQESYARAYVALAEGRYRERDAGFDAWMMRIVTHAAIDLSRARRRDHARADRDARIEELAGDADASRLASLRSLAHAIEALAPDQRAALVLREIEGFTIKETAAALGCSEGAVEQRVLRAWAALRRRLSDG